MKIIHLCGKVGVGKTTYAKKLVKEENAVYLNRDELVFKLFPNYPAQSKFHDEIEKTSNEYLVEKAVEIARAGATVILEGRNWFSHSRKEMRDFFTRLGIPFEMHFIDVHEEKRLKQLEKRNREIKSGKNKTAYFIDDGIFKKCEELFQRPKPDEIDVYIFEGVKS